jgi:hypothetical protein
MALICLLRKALSSVCVQLQHQPCTHSGGLSHTTSEFLLSIFFYLAPHNYRTRKALRNKIFVERVGRCLSVVITVVEAFSFKRYAVLKNVY